MVNMSAEYVLSLFRDGNSRFSEGRPERPNRDKARRIQTADEGQHPLAAVLSCSDSRVPVELLFDCGIGDLYSVRVSGNCAGSSQIASLEFAAERLGVPVIIVLGHTNCSAVHAALNFKDLYGDIGRLFGLIVPAVVETKTRNRELTGPMLVDTIAKANVRQSIADIMKNSYLIKDRVRHGRLKLVGAFYNIRKGVVEWLDAAPQHTVR
jgi:carbonic anhydrase